MGTVNHNFGLLTQVKIKPLWKVVRYSVESTRKVFSLALIYERNKPWWKQILDPASKFVDQWNHIFLVSLLFSLLLDPMYFFLPYVTKHVACMGINLGLSITITLFRTFFDLFVWLHIAMKFRTAYVVPSTNILGKRELVTDPKMIANRYLKSTFIIDFLAALPLPQIVIYGISPAVQNNTSANANHAVSLIIVLQFIPRLCVMIPLNNRIVKTTGVVAKTAWTGAAYNLLLYMLCGHVLGSSWYLLSIERQFRCWSGECRKENHGGKTNGTQFSPCHTEYFDCKTLDRPDRKTWIQGSKVLKHCDAKGHDEFDFGIFKRAFTEDVASAEFINKYFYSLWWGMRNLCSFGQNLETSTNVGEILYCCLIVLVGLVLFATLIGNIQKYIVSTTARLEEWRVKRKDTEEWMNHRQLPQDLQDRVRAFVQYQWLATRGVVQEDMLKELPADVRREIQRHLCLALVRRVPFFSQMDDQLLDAICEHLVSSLNTKDSYLLREDDPVKAMLFIIRGQVESSTTNGGRTGFFNSITLKPGDFCGEELLTWALMPNPSATVPLSTRTVKSLTEVEAFALGAEDLKFVANQFKRLHSKKLQQAFRYYSHQWRTWGACFIQTAWRRNRKRKLARELARREGYLSEEDYSDSTDDDDNAAEETKMLTRKVTFVEPDMSSLDMPKRFFKPDEPNFSEE